MSRRLPHVLMAIEPTPPLANNFDLPTVALATNICSVLCLTELLGLARQQTNTDISLYTRFAPENLRSVIDVTAARCQASTLYYSRWKDIVYREHCGRIE